MFTVRKTLFLNKNKNHNYNDILDAKTIYQSSTQRVKEPYVPVKESHSLKNSARMSSTWVIQQRRVKYLHIKDSKFILKVI